MPEPSDRNLMDAHLGGDSEAFGGLVRRHGPVVLGYLLKMTQNKDHAEDLFQETFRRACEYAGQFRGDKIKPWLLSIATNAAINAQRKQQRTATVSLSQPACTDGEHCPAPETAVVAETDGPETIAEHNEQARRVRRSLLKLPDKQRAALVLCYYHKLSHRQIAEAMDCSVGAVKTHLFRALKTLKPILAEPANGIQ